MENEIENGWTELEAVADSDAAPIAGGHANMELTDEINVEATQENETADMEGVSDETVNGEEDDDSPINLEYVENHMRHAGSNAGPVSFSDMPMVLGRDTFVKYDATKKRKLVSRSHALIEAKRNPDTKKIDYFLRDTSVNGTFLGANRLSPDGPPAKLEHGDVIGILTSHSSPLETYSPFGDYFTVTLGLRWMRPDTAPEKIDPNVVVEHHIPIMSRLHSEYAPGTFVDQDFSESEDEELHSTQKTDHTQKSGSSRSTRSVSAKGSVSARSTPARIRFKPHQVLNPELIKKVTIYHDDYINGLSANGQLVAGHESLAHGHYEWLKGEFVTKVEVGVTATNFVNSLLFTTNAGTIHGRDISVSDEPSSVTSTSSLYAKAGEALVGLKSTTKVNPDTEDGAELLDSIQPVWGPIFVTSSSSPPPRMAHTTPRRKRTDRPSRSVSVSSKRTTRSGNDTDDTDGDDEREEGAKSGTSGREGDNRRKPVIAISKPSFDEANYASPMSALKTPNANGFDYWTATPSTTRRGTPLRSLTFPAPANESTPTATTPGSYWSLTPGSRDRKRSRPVQAEPESAEELEPAKKLRVQDEI